MFPNTRSVLTTLPWLVDELFGGDLLPLQVIVSSKQDQESTLLLQLMKTVGTEEIRNVFATYVTTMKSGKHRRLPFPQIFERDVPSEYFVQTCTPSFLRFTFR